MERLRKLVRWAMREKVHGGCHNLAQVPRMIRGVFHEFPARPWGPYRTVESISSYFFEKTSRGISLISRVLRRGWGVRAKNFAERSCEVRSFQGSLRPSPPRCFAPFQDEGEGEQDRQRQPPTLVHGRQHEEHHRQRGEPPVDPPVPGLDARFTVHGAGQ